MDASVDFFSTVSDILFAFLSESQVRKVIGKCIHNFVIYLFFIHAKRMRYNT